MKKSYKNKSHFRGSRGRLAAHCCAVAGTPDGRDEDIDCSTVFGKIRRTTALQLFLRRRFRFRQEKGQAVHA